MVRTEAIEYLFASVLVRIEAYSTVFFKCIFCFIVILTFKPVCFFQRPAQTRKKIFYQTFIIQIHLKDNWNIHNPNTYILINTIVHLNYEFFKCYPTKLYGLRRNWHRTLECLRNKTLT